MMGVWEGGFNRGSYFIPKEIPTSEFVYPKKNPYVFNIQYPKKSLTNSKLLISADEKYNTPKKPFGGGGGAGVFFLHPKKIPVDLP